MKLEIIPISRVLVIGHSIIRSNGKYYKVIGCQGNKYICEEITVPIIRRLFDGLIEVFTESIKGGETMGAKAKPAVKKPMPKKGK